MKAMVLVCVLVLAAAGAAFAGEPATTNTPSRPQYPDEHLRQLLQEAIVLARAGLYDEAEQRCLTIVAQQPDQATAKQLLKEIQDKQLRISRKVHGVDLKGKLNDIIVPELDVHEANAVDVIEFLRTESKRLSVDKTEINFVWQVPPDQRLPKVSLNLRQIPLIDAIRYVTQLAKLSYRVETHAVVIYVPGKGALSSAPSNAKSQ
jgi:hypothetical protein